MRDHNISKAFQGSHVFEQLSRANLLPPIPYSRIHRSWLLLPDSGPFQNQIIPLSLSLSFRGWGEGFVLLHLRGDGSPEPLPTLPWVLGTKLLEVPQRPAFQQRDQPSGWEDRATKLVTYACIHNMYVYMHTHMNKCISAFKNTYRHYMHSDIPCEILLRHEDHKPIPAACYPASDMKFPHI